MLSGYKKSCIFEARKLCMYLNINKIQRSYCKWSQFERELQHIFFQCLSNWNCKWSQLERDHLQWSLNPLSHRIKTLIHPTLPTLNIHECPSTRLLRRVWDKKQRQIIPHFLNHPTLSYTIPHSTHSTNRTSLLIREYNIKQDLQDLIFSSCTALSYWHIALCNYGIVAFF